MQVQTWQRSKRTSIFENKQTTNRVIAFSTGRAIMVFFPCAALLLLIYEKLESGMGGLTYAIFFFQITAAALHVQKSTVRCAAVPAQRPRHSVS